ncbi:MAG: hypothetical protein KAJ19_27885, partial [Gammaproteobacteria bacterium]|nr:hypothetical protein [Gammaproteobacteria bacterium]
RETTTIEENIGIALKSSRKFGTSLGAEFELPTVPLSPEQAVHVFEAGIKKVNTGVADGTASTGYTFTYPFGATSINAIAAYSVETGDESGAEVAEYCFVKEFTVSAVKGEAVQISSSWMGRQVDTQAFTGAVSAPSVTEVHASAGALYIDDAGGSFGGTPVAAGNLLEATLKVSTGRTALFTADSGQLYFQQSYFNIDDFEATLELKWVHDTAAIAEKAKWRADAERLVRVEFTGETYGTPGSGTLFTGGKSGIQIDFPGAYDEFSAIEHEDGKSIITASLSGGYENVGADVLQLIIAAELVAVP